MMTLVERLSSLNSADNQQGIWVNPTNANEEWRIGQLCFDNGGRKDDWFYVGNLESLSFGFQSTHEAIEAFLRDNPETEFNGRKVRLNREGILSAYDNDRLHQDFRAFLEEEAESYKETWAKEEAWSFVFDRIPEMIQDCQLSA